MYSANCKPSVLVPPNATATSTIPTGQISLTPINTFPVQVPMSSPESPDVDINRLVIDETSSASANANTSLPLDVSLMSEGTLAATLTDTSANVTIGSVNTTHHTFDPADL